LEVCALMLAYPERENASSYMYIFKIYLLNLNVCACEQSKQFYLQFSFIDTEMLFISNPRNYKESGKYIVQRYSYHLKNSRASKEEGKSEDTE
jgi:hypothetical protein